jgi:hypothetical protein
MRRIYVCSSCTLHGQLFLCIFGMEECVGTELLRNCHPFDNFGRCLNRIQRAGLTRRRNTNRAYLAAHLSNLDVHLPPSWTIKMYSDTHALNCIYKITHHS